MLNHLPILQIIVPLLAAPLCLLLNKARLAWLFALLAGLLSLLISGLLLQQVLTGGTISYFLGGWAAPWGIEYRIDALSAYVLLIVSGIGALVLIAAGRGIQYSVDTAHQPLFYVLYLLCLSGLLGIVATGDVFNVFVFLEVSSLASYALIACGNDRRGLWASYQYLIVGTIGATFFLIGIGFLYALTGTLNMADMAQRLPAVESTATAGTAFAFIVVGIGLKLALFPLHLWLPNAYAYSPSIVTAFLAATATKVSVYLLIRMMYTVFGIEFTASLPTFNALLLTLGLGGVFVASLVAIRQTHIKRLFAFSSVAQVGYMIIGIGLGNATGLQATLLHLFNHALMKATLFLAICGVVMRFGDARRERFNGLGRQMPWTMAAIVVAGLSLIGVPLTVGFVSKWYLVQGAIEAGMWPVALLLVAGSLLAVYYIWGLVEAAYFSKPAADSPPAQEAPLSLLLPIWMLAVANLYFGIDTRLPVAASQFAVQLLLGGQP